MIKLRALTTDDIASTLNWHNQSEIRDNYLGHPFPINIEVERAWYEKHIKSNIPTCIFGIELQEVNVKLIGVTVLRDINFINRSCEIAIFIGDEEMKGKGYGKIATKLAIEFAFKDLGLRRVCLKVLKTNTKAINMYKSIGFKVEGEFRESVFKKGHFCNEILMSILENERL